MKLFLDVAALCFLVAAAVDHSGNRFMRKDLGRADQAQLAVDVKGNVVRLDDSSGHVRDKSATELLQADTTEEPTELLRADTTEEPTELLRADTTEEPTDLLGGDTTEKPPADSKANLFHDDSQTDSVDSE